MSFQKTTIKIENLLVFFISSRNHRPRNVFVPDTILEIYAAVVSRPGLSYTTYPLFQAYAVEGWWLDNLLKGGKLTRQTYLTTVGFQKRLGDCKAAERFLREEVVRDKPHIWMLVCKSMKYSIPHKSWLTKWINFAIFSLGSHLVWVWNQEEMGTESCLSIQVQRTYVYSYIRIYIYICMYF